jgi:predicted Zn-dependent protease
MLPARSRPVLSRIPFHRANNHPQVQSENSFRARKCFLQTIATCRVCAESRLSEHLDAEGLLMDKAAMLLEILSVNPKDAFARYGLAMEYAGASEFDAAMREFGTLLADHPDYVPGYFMAAQTLVRAQKPAEAMDKLRAGIALAQQSGNRHAQSEMQALLDELELDV